MTKICLLSDTHSFLDEPLVNHLRWADEIWHAGDVGDEATLDKISGIAPIRGVYGNIDGTEIRTRLPEVNYFVINELKVLMTHIGGYPPKYNTRVRELLMEHKPHLLVCGHSHILKIMRDPYSGMLHMNPGAAGKHGFHKIRTFIRFRVLHGKVAEPEVVELGKRGALA